MTSFVGAEADPMCDLPEDSKVWISDKTLEQIVAEWPTMLKEGPNWQVYLAAKEGQVTAEKFALIQSSTEQ